MIDTSEMMFPKKLRIKDKKVSIKVKKNRCEMPNCKDLADKLPHHIYSRGSGGPDVEENEIQLCIKCHDLAHRGKLSKLDLFKIVSKRMRRDIDELMEYVKSLCV